MENSWKRREKIVSHHRKKCVKKNSPTNRYIQTTRKTRLPIRISSTSKHHPTNQQKSTKTSQTFKAHLQRRLDMRLPYELNLLVYFNNNSFVIEELHTRQSRVLKPLLISSRSHFHLVLDIKNYWFFLNIHYAQFNPWMCRSHCTYWNKFLLNNVGFIRTFLF